MKRKFIPLFIIVSLLFFYNNTCLAQTDTLQNSRMNFGKMYVIKTVNGKSLIGSIIEDNENGILLLTKELGKVRIPKYDIESITELNYSNYSNGVYKNNSNFPTRYLLNSNGLNMKKGEAYFHTTYFLLYDIQYAVTDNITVGGMTTFWGAPFLLSAKYTTKLNENTSLGLGVLAGPIALFSPSSGSIIIPYTSLTFGGKRNNFSITGGYPTFTGENSTGSQFVYSFGAMTGISKSSFFVFDSYFFNVSNISLTLLLPGIRVESTKRPSAWSFHFGGAGRDGKFLPIPIVLIAYAYKFE